MYIASSPGPLRGGERAWYTLNAPIKFIVKFIGYCQYVAKYAEKLVELRVRSSLEC